MKLGKLRTLVFVIWISGVLVCGLAFGVKLSGVSDLFPGETTFVVYSMSSIFGLLVPQLNLILTFVLSDDGASEAVWIDQGRALVVVGMTTAYQIIMAALVVYGIVYLGFDQRADGEALARNTALVVAIGGMLSFMVVTPVTILFKK